jgi:hypothetical protein
MREKKIFKFAFELDLLLQNRESQATRHILYGILSMDCEHEKRICEHLMYFSASVEVFQKNAI